MSRRSWVLFAAMCLIWGVPYLLIRVAVRDLDPATLVFGRTAIGALLLLPAAARRGRLRGLRPYWRPLAAYTVAEVTVPWLLLTSAEEHLTSSMSGLLVAGVPLVGVLLARLGGGSEPVGARRWAGLLLGLAGVAALVGLQVGRIDLSAVAEVLVVVLGYAAGPLILARRLREVPGIAVVAVSLAATAVVTAPWAVRGWSGGVGFDAAASVVTLAVVCTALAFLVFLALIEAIGPTRATVITYLNPAVAIALGVAVLGEPFTAGMAVGFPLVLAGSVLATTRPRRRVTAVPAPA